MTAAEFIEEFSKTTSLLAQSGYRRLRLFHTGNNYRVTFYNNERATKNHKFMKVLIDTDDYAEAFEAWEKNARELIYEKGM